MVDKADKAGTLDLVDSLVGMVGKVDMVDMVGYKVLGYIPDTDSILDYNFVVQGYIQQRNLSASFSLEFQLEV